MTQKIQELVEKLEHQVAERTSSLQTVAEVSSAAAMVLDPSVLLKQTVELVRNDLGFIMWACFCSTRRGALPCCAQAPGKRERRCWSEGTGWRWAVIQ